MKTPIQRPSIFLRLFLSHLLMLLFSFGVGLFVFDALFAPGLRPFLQRSPSILIPAVLALIGVAGLLAVWTATSITHPLERLAKCVDENDAAADLEDIAASAPLEIAELAQALHVSRQIAEFPLEIPAEQSETRFPLDYSESGTTGAAEPHDSPSADSGGKEVPREVASSDTVDSVVPHDVPSSTNDETSAASDSELPAGADDSDGPETPPPPRDNLGH